MASDTVVYEEICLYADGDDDITAFKNFLENNSIKYSPLIYPDSTECKAALSTWKFGPDNETVDITFPILIYRDTRYAGPPKFFITQCVKSPSVLPVDFIEKAQKQG